MTKTPLLLAFTRFYLTKGLAKLGLDAILEDIIQKFFASTKLLAFLIVKSLAFFDEFFLLFRVLSQGLFIP